MVEDINSNIQNAKPTDKNAKPIDKNAKPVNKKKKQELLLSEDSNDSDKILVLKKIKKKPNLNTSISSSTTSKDSNKEDLTKKVTKTITTKENKIISSKKKENIQPSVSTTAKPENNNKNQKNKLEFLDNKKTKSIETNKQKIEPIKEKPKSPLKLNKDLTGFKIPKLKTNEPQSSNLRSLPTTSNSLKKSNESIKKSINILKSKKSPFKSSKASTDDKKNEEQKNLKNTTNKLTLVSAAPAPETTQLSNTKPKNDFLLLLNKNEEKNKKSPTIPFQYPKNEISLNELNENRFNYNKSFGWDHPAFSLSFLVSEYIKTFSKMAGSLDFDFLNSHIKKNNDLYQLSNDERLELCKLMSRTAGRLNKFSMLGIDYTLDEMTNMPDIKKYGKNTKNLYKYLPLEFESEAEENQYLLYEISKLSIGLSYSVYEYYAQRFSSPYRNIQLCSDAKSNSNNIKITFQNDKIIESEDSSIEACVKYICHR